MSIPDKPPKDHVSWVSYLRKRAPGNFRVFRHYDEREQNSIHIFTSENDRGVVAATVGLMDFDQQRGSGPPIATEILLDGRGRPPSIANIAATIAFFITKDGWKVAPD